MDWSTYTPIYVRASGNDANSGLSVFNAVATVQHAYNIAAGMSGNVVLDLDAHTYAGIGHPELGLGLTADWPARIGVRGVSATTSFLGGINGSGINDDANGDGLATNGWNLTIVSDGTVKSKQFMDNISLLFTIF